MLEPGTQVERYVVEALLGRGAMAAVYRVRHRTLRTLHALKVLTLSSERVRDRLIQEGQVQAQLRHPNVLSVTDVLDVGGAPGLLMEFIDGPALDAWLEENKPGLDEAERVFRGIMGGMHEAHTQGLVHRDLKPANVLCARNSSGLVPKVADFGLAKVIEEEEGGGLHRTRSGSALGTPAYMAPEQIRDAKSVDSRADMFSLGAILYELVVHQRAFNGEDLLTVFNQVASGSHQPIPEGTPPRLERAIRGCLTVDREKRIADCATLKSVLDGEADSWATTGGFVRRRGSLSDILKEAQPAAAAAVAPAVAPAVGAVPKPAGRPMPSSSETMDLDADDAPADSQSSLDTRPGGTLAPGPSGTLAPVATTPAAAVAPAPRRRLGLALGGGLGAVILLAGLAFLLTRPEPGAPEPAVAVAVPEPATEPAGSAPPPAAVPVTTPPPAPPVDVTASPTVAPTAAPKPKPAAAAKPARPTTPVEATPAPTPKPAATGTGVLRISSNPYSVVTIDGAERGNTGKPYTVPAGSHSVTLRTSSGLTKSTTLSVGTGESKTFCWDFEMDDKCS